MCKVIQFPTRESNGYKNLTQLIQIADNIGTLNFYIESIDQLENMGALLPGEREKLTEQGRSKRLELAKPEPVEAEKPEKPGTYIYTPEMGQEKPECQMEASRSYYGNHMYVDTPLEIKGRGITFIKKYESKHLTASGQYKVGWNEYRVTNLAFKKLEEKYTISMECLLD